MQDKTSNHAPIPTELNIAPCGKSWLHGQLIDGEHGHPTRQSMESAERAQAIQCACPSGDGSLRWPCPAHPPTASAASDERKDLVPGVMRCAKCEFQLVRKVLAVNLGEVFAGDSKTEPCPNGCGPLWPVTWKQYAEQAMDAAETMADRAFAAEKEVKLLRGELVQHSDEVAVDALASLMKAKLAKQRDKGYGGWDDTECSQQHLSNLLRGHVDKGDPVDVANFCAFLSARGEGIAPQAAPAAVAATASPTFMTADQGRDWAWNNVREYVGTEGWTVMDSVNFHGFFLYGWNYRGQYELQRTATRTAVMQEILTAAPAAVAVPAKLPTSDEIRAIARSVSTSSSDSPSPSEYVMAGYRAALAATTGDHVAQARNILGPRQNHLPNCRDDACLECSSLIPDEWVNKTPAAAPVVLPEPVAWRHSRTYDLHDTEDEVQLADGDEHAQPLFTEQQVRALLAGVSAPAAQAVERIVHLRVDRQRRIYVAGPMTGLPEFNFPAFNSAADKLRAEEWHVENPAEHGHIEGADWADYLRWDISRIATCGAIYLLPGWENSKGATLEVSIAKALGMQFILAPGAAPQAQADARDAQLLAFAVSEIRRDEMEHEPVLYVSKGQLGNFRDPDGPDSTAHGRYLPARVTPSGKFTTPLFAAPQALADARDADVLEWLLPNLHPANFGLEFDNDKLDENWNAEFKRAILAAADESTAIAAQAAQQGEKQ